MFLQIDIKIRKVIAVNTRKTIKFWTIMYWCLSFLVQRIKNLFLYSFSAVNRISIRAPTQEHMVYGTTGTKCN